MKNIIIKIVLIIVAFGISLNSKATDTGFSAGAEGAMSFQRDGDIHYWNVGAFGAYEYDFNQLFYVKPIVGFNYNHAIEYLVPGMFYSKGYTPWFLTLSADIMGGLNLGKGWSFNTGPNLNIVLAYPKDPVYGDTLKLKRANLNWNFGFSKRFGKFDLSLVYNQHLTAQRKMWGTNNVFKLAVGYRF